MGMDAKVEIWVGVRSEDCCIDEIVDKLPSDMFDENGGAVWRSEDYEKAYKKYGCVPDRICCSEDDAGFGLTVFSHDWDYGAVAFDTKEVERRIIEESLKLKVLFDSFGIDNEIRAWCQTDYR